MKYYRDFREYIDELEKRKKLYRIRSEINKDTELMPVVRWEFRGLRERQRRAFLFENIIDSTGRRFNGNVIVGAYAASKNIYSIGMHCKPGEIFQKWSQALLNPIQPEIIDNAPAYEEVHLGEELKEMGRGLDEFPIPISTPGFDPAPYITGGHWVTRDPDTGILNIGTYRAQIKGPNRTGVRITENSHIRIHWDKCRKISKPLEAAVIIGVPPCIAYASVAKVPYGLSEYAVAGGIAGEPMKLVKCRTIDIEVPSTAEIVLEGEISTKYLEEEAPFGEYTGYMGERRLHPYFEIKFIAHRKSPIYAAFISQFPPSESTKLKQMANEPTLYNYLTNDMKITNIKDIAFHEYSGSMGYCVIQLKDSKNFSPWDVLYAAVSKGFNFKFIIAVDDDIDIRNPDAVIWAQSFRVQPLRDIKIIKGKAASLDPSVISPYLIDEGKDPSGEGGILLIDATRKWDYSPVSLPKKEYMQSAKEIWKKEKLPRLIPQVPWYGYHLGYWKDEFNEEAALAVNSKYYETGIKHKRNRKLID